MALPTFGMAQSFWDYPRSLWIVRGREEVKATYWAEGQFQLDGYSQICHIMRDVQANELQQMDPVLLDILRGLQGWLVASGVNRPINLHSGYRSAKTNAKTEGASKNSKHKSGRAADLSIKSIPPDYLRQVARYLNGGGVGFYPDRNFIHVDTGRVREWRG
ncbi:YcbK family protein [Azonexus hydrophilus]|uniref:Murein endopeptidase K n=1 Tax=Azonexus hydrophilus TaxID=418702 RepID=A0ABZ2XLJ2_9RHOO